MHEEVVLKNGRKAIKASYCSESVLGENNPLLDVLNPLPDDKVLIKSLSKYPKYSEENRYLDKEMRILLTSNINTFFQMLPESLDVVHKINSMLWSGYRSRNPFSRDIAIEHQNMYHELHGYTSNIESGLNAASNCVIIGVSGSGKTSTVLNSIKSLYPQLIVHSEYKGHIFSAYQCLFIFATMSKDGSVKSLFYDIMTQVDVLLDTNHAAKAKNDSADILLLKVKSMLLNIHCGCLVIDEFQHISLQKSGGKDRILNIFLSLSDIGIPVLIISTPQGISLLQESGFRQVRRNLSSGGSIIYDRIKDKNKWKFLIKSLWKYQYCQRKVELTDDFIDLFYDLSLGLPSMLKSLYQAVQIDCIRSNKETFDKESILKVFNNQFQMAIPAVRAFRSNILKEMIKHPDLYIPMDKVQELSAFEEVETKRQKTMVTKKGDKSNLTVSLKNNEDKAIKTVLPVMGDIRSIIKLNADSSESNYAVLKAAGYISDMETDVVIGGQNL